MNKNIIIFEIVIALIAIGIAIISIIKKKKDMDIWPFYAKKPLSKPELILYYQLIDALPNHMILAQVQLSRVLSVKKGFNFGEWHNRINRMSLDFLICNEDSSIVAAIELDDKTHEQESRKKADAKKDKALKSANIRIIRWNVKAIPNSAEIKKSIIQG